MAATRWAEGSTEAGATLGAQAGDWIVEGSNRLAISLKDGVRYLHHSLEGTEVDSPGTTRWRLLWTAPEAATDAAVVLHLAANAANGDNSEFGDRIYTSALRAGAPE